MPNTPFSLISNSTQWNLEQISANHLRLTGQVEIESGAGLKFFADVIDIFTDPNLRLVASGNVVFTNPEGRLAAERVEFNVVDGTGTFYQASGSLSLGLTADRAQFGNQDPDVYFYGETIEKLSERSYRLTRGGFTTCVQPTPRWEITSGSVMINMDDYAIARNMLLRVKGVPLMYLPLIYYPIQEDDRATGFLLPTYGSSSLRGQTLSNAFFWAIGRSQDATLYHDWFTQAGQGAGAEYRYAAGQGSYGNFKFYRFSQREAEFTRGAQTTVLPNQTTFQILGNGIQFIGQSVRAYERIDYISNLVTQQLYQQNFSQASNSTRTIEAGISGVWGGFTTSAQYLRAETFATATDSQVYGSSPRVTAAFAPQRLFGLPIYGSVNTEYSFLPSKSLRSGETISDRSLGRVDVQPALRAALSRLTFLTVNSTLSYRTTYYNRNAATTDSLNRRYLAERTEVIGPVLTKIWDTPASGFSERMKHVIEPTFAFEYVTDIANQPLVPILTDTADNVFGGSTRFTYGLNNRLLLRARTPDGTPGPTVEYLTIGIQQTYYGTAKASRNDTTYVSNAFNTRAMDLSAVALTIRGSSGSAFNSTGRIEYDVQGEGLQVVTAGMTASAGTAGRLSTGTLSFSRQRPNRLSKPTSSLGGSTSVNFLNGRARGTYSLNWDIAGAGILSQSAGGAYLAQCCGLQVDFQKYKYPVANPNFPIASDRRFNVSFMLAGLGTFSNFFGALGLGQ